jgi:hypothetical protein
MHHNLSVADIRNRMGNRFWVAVGVSATIFALCAIAAFLLPASAQAESPHHVGIVVQFGQVASSDIYTACVDVGSDGVATGEEVLQGSGLPLVVAKDETMGTSTVCKIDSYGCDFPSEPCFCQCTGAYGEPCHYWNYYHVIDGAWEFSNIGASSYRVQAGAVEGWMWGEGRGNTSLPLLAFEEICSVASPTPTATATVPMTATATATTTPSPMPSPTPTITPTLSPTVSPTPRVEGGIVFLPIIRKP